MRCINIEKGLRVENDGVCRVCCMSEKWLTDGNGSKLNIASNSFDELYTAKERQEMLELFEKGIWDKSCYKCKSEELAGKTSKRQTDNKFYLKRIDNEKKIQILDLNMGNTCNIKCRTCGPYNSSKWVQEWRELGLDNSSSLEEYHSFIRKFSHSFEEDSAFWKNFENSIKDIVHIDFYGGEPFLVKKQWEMIKKAVELGVAQDISVHYNTNGTIYDEKYFEILKNFYEVRIDFSIDGVDNKLNYIRHPAKWDTVYNNFIKVNNFGKEHTNFSISVCNTISTLNVFYIEEIFDVFFEHTGSVYLNLVFEPEHYCIQNIPEDIKKTISKKLKNHKNAKNTYWIDMIIKFMFGKTCNYNKWNKFLEITKKQDVLRKENFNKTFPEFAEIITEHGYNI